MTNQASSRKQSRIKVVGQRSYMTDPLCQQWVNSDESLEDLIEKMLDRTKKLQREVQTLLETRRIEIALPREDEEGQA